MRINKSIVDLMRNNIKRTTLFVILSIISLVISYISGDDLPVDPAWVAIILCGTPIVWEAITGLVLRHDIKADVLVAIAIVASLIMKEYFAAGEVALIMEIGGLLEEMSASRSRAGIEQLINLMPSTARIITSNGDEIVPADDIEVGSIIRILPGETVPLDGRIVSGHSYLDQSSLTGESVPVSKQEGDEVFSGTVNQLGSFDIEVTCSAEDSSFQRLVDMVRSTDADRTRIVRLADRWATYLVAIVFLIAAAAYIASGDVSRALTVMIVFCPCAFILATPTAVVAAIGNLSKHGVLVRDGDSIEKMSKVDRVVFDKTGTITRGRPEVSGIIPLSDMSDTDLMYYASSVESRSEHPLGKAIVNCARSMGVDSGVPDNVSVSVGRGISANVDGKKVSIGNLHYMEDEGIAIPETVSRMVKDAGSSGSTAVMVAVDRIPSGIIVIGDTIREGVSDTIIDIRSRGSECVLLTGDSRNTAVSVSAAVGIKDTRSECRPEDKLRNIRELQDEGYKVCMIGDGINDAPSLKTADVGIAMGGTGSGITVDVADMVIVGDEIGRIPHLMFISRKMMSRIKFNIVFGMSWNAVAVMLAFLGTVGPVGGAIVHNIGSVFVVVSSFLLLFSAERRTSCKIPGCGVIDMNPGTNEQL